MTEQPTAHTDDRLVVACDESGNDGENVLAGSSPVFAHASVALSMEEAAEIMAEVRTRTRSQSQELKSKTILQPRHEATARWLLERLSRTNAASVHLTHKRYFIVSKLFDSTIEETARAGGYDMYADGSALCGANILYFFGPPCHGEEWDELLLAFQHFLRAKTTDEATDALAKLSTAFESVLAIETPMSGFLGMAFTGISHLRSLSALQLGQGITHRLRTLDPLIPAVGATVAVWAETSGRPVEIVHDAALELTPERIAVLRSTLARPEDISSHYAGRGSDLTALTLADSQHDERVQVADLVAGLARAVGEQRALGREHPLDAAIVPLINPYSIWPDKRLMDPTEARAVANRA